jgi:hypothetical protein
LSTGQTVASLTSESPSPSGDRIDFIMPVDPCHVIYRPFNDTVERANTSRNRRPNAMSYDTTDRVCHSHNNGAPFIHHNAVATPGSQTKKGSVRHES